MQFKKDHHTKLSAKRRYRISLFNESQFREILSVKLSRIQFIITMIFVALGIIGIFVILIIATPLRSILPGYMQPAQRHEAINNAIRIDSIATMAYINDAYIDNIKNILTDNIDSATPHTIDSTSQKLPLDSLLPSSELEKEFVKQFEEREKYNLSVLSPIAAEGMTFYNPVSGATPLIFNTPRLEFITSNVTPVSSVYRGTIISITYDNTDKYTVIIQHPNDFISKYAGLNDVFVLQGDKVNAGTRLGLHTKSKDTAPFTFELWHNGTALNPTEYISF